MTTSSEPESGALTAAVRELVEDVRRGVARGVPPSRAAVEEIFRASPRPVLAIAIRALVGLATPEAAAAYSALLRDIEPEEARAAPLS